MNYQTYRALFIGWAFQPSSGVASFSMSDDDRVLNIQPDTLYPLLELDTPNYDIKAPYGAKHTKLYRGAISITDTVANDDFQGQDECLDRLEPILDNLIAYLLTKRDILQPWLRDINFGEAFPIKRFETDNKWGWGVDFSIEVNANYCIKNLEEHFTVNLDPSFELGKEALQLLIEDELFGAAWVKTGDINRSLDSLVQQINDHFDDIKAIRYLQTLILIHQAISTPINYQLLTDSHPWQGFDTCGPIDKLPIENVVPAIYPKIHDQYHTNEHE